MNITYKIPNNYKSNYLKEFGVGSSIYCVENLHAIVEMAYSEMLQKKKTVGKNT